MKCFNLGGVICLYCDVCHAVCIITLLYKGNMRGVARWRCSARHLPCIGHSITQPNCYISQKYALSIYCLIIDGQCCVTNAIITV